MAGRETAINASTLEQRPRTGGDDAISGNGIDAERRPGQRRRIIIPILAIVLTIGIIFGVRYWIFASHHVSTDDAQIAGNITTISSKVKGQVLAIYVAENQFVRKSGNLLKLDDRDYKVAVQQAQAAYQQALSNYQAATTAVPQQSAVTAAQTAQAQAGVAQTESGVTNAMSALAAAREKVAQAQQNYEAARASAVDASKTFARDRVLASQGAISQSQLDSAQAAYTAAVANRDAAAQQIAVAQAGVRQAQDAVSAAQAAVQASEAQVAQAQTGTETTQIKSAQASVGLAQAKAAAAALANAKLQESYTLITAPVDGVVSKKSVNVGDTISVGQPLMAVADESHLWVTANLKETQLTNVRVGQPVTVHVDAYPHQTFTGRVESISPATGATFALIPPDNASGNFTKVVQRIPVRISIDQSSDPQHVLRQGLSVEVSIDTTNH